MAKPFRHRDKWRIKWNDEHGRRHSELFDTYDDAKFKLAQYEAEVQEIKRGLRGLRVPDKTFNQLCDHWIEVRVPPKRSGKNDISVIRAHLRPFFGPVVLTKISPPMAAEFVRSRSHLHKKTIDNHLILLKAMLNEAKDAGWINDTPNIRRPRIPRIDENYRYIKTEKEIQRFLAAAREHSEIAFVMYSAATYTGMRAGELAGLRRDDVDLDKRLITVQHSYNGPTKSGKTRHVPILDALLPILRRWMLKCPTEFVFPNAAGNMHTPSSRIFQEVLRSVLKSAGFPNRIVNGKPRGYIVFHDLRHTFASHWVMNGGDVFKLQRILGHADMQMTMRYSHLNPAAFADDYGRFGAGPGLKPATVTPLKKRSS